VLQTPASSFPSHPSHLAFGDLGRGLLTARKFKLALRFNFS
jgi:hypothetical protein